jgi:hypothetical protein
MHADVVYKVLKTVGWVVLASIVAAMLYAGFISVSNWSGIGV